MHFTDAQFYYLKQMTKGTIPYDILKRWDQRPLRGMHVRGWFSLSSKLSASITQLGWRVFQGTLRAKCRKNPSNPLFGRRLPSSRLLNEDRRRIAR